ncbi:GlxA family transcriptional regulator [Spiribacter halobius]|uniref:AraC family transcriptional regulator n=1 Tax=Sediminicurvatus halobius TaxID=2182432 RepID=A0A2U2N8L1_9GAMM|nr:helix-turn-helix domain-containing protein [Spiribacter halobius]PWG65428.1 AraC family transcriptional regulator [Spiribacter halobius]UEX76448.1 helix-turn-helix domain-containing protein [Spiribacter halobius]
MIESAPPEVALLAVSEATASTLHGAYDMLCSPGRDWPLLTTGAPGRSLLRPRIVSADGSPFRVSNGVQVAPHARIADCPRPAVVCVLELLVAPEQPLAGRYAREIDWLRDCYEAGALIGAACTGGLLLAEAGLLDGREATTHWAYCEALARRHPGVRVRPECALLSTGEGGRIVMAGGGTSWIDLVLLLVARLLGPDEAMRLARLHLVDWHDRGQLHFAALATRPQREDAVIADAQAWLACHYDAANPVRAVVARSGLAERSFKRRFARATGMAPIEYVHNLRVEEAKYLLETTADPVEAIANQVGYEEASFFGRLFRRRVGLTPAAYRRRFAGLRTRLAG